MKTLNYKNIFSKYYTLSCSKEVFVIKKVKDTVPWTYVIEALNGEERLQKTNQTEFRIEKVIKKKGDKIYVRWKGYDSSFDSCKDKKDTIIENELLPRTR